MATTAPLQILLIDDDSRNIFALTAVLKSRGFACLTTTIATEGLRLLDSQPAVGIVLLDMMMPEMDGYETLSRIRNGTRSDIPVIAVTAQAMAGDREKCMQAGPMPTFPNPSTSMNCSHCYIVTYRNLP